MKCDQCGQRSDWLGADRGWRPVHDGTPAVHALYECTECGNTQRLR